MNFQQQLAMLQAGGITIEGASALLKPEYRGNYKLAMDAQPGLVTNANSAIPQMLTAFVDPSLLRVMTAKNAAAEIFGEVRKGSLTDQTAIFPVLEYTGEVASYGDFNNGGVAGVNTAFPTHESYIYQAIIEYGDLEMERMGLAKIGWAAEKKMGAVNTLNKYQNKTYFYGVAGLNNYGLLNHPDLPTPIAPAPKASGNLKWMVNGAVTASANEVFTDIQSLVTQVVIQTSGLVDAKSKMVLAMSPVMAMALNTTNQFNVNVYTLLERNFPNLEVKTAVQYGAVSAANPEGSVAGELIQLIATELEGQDTGYMAFNEKLRMSPVIRDMTSYKQKLMQGTWGCILRQPANVSQMIGV